jgi:hypothetical protein
MVMRSDQPANGRAAAGGEPIAHEVEGRAGHIASEPRPSVVRSALVFAVRCHAGQRRQSDGAAFIEHPLEVAGLLHDARCSDVVVAAGLLHDVVEESHVTVAELAWRFGSELAGIAKVRELPELVRRDGARLEESGPGGRARELLQRHHRLRLEHYRRSLRMLQRAAPAHPLVRQLASDLDYCPTAIRRIAAAADGAPPSLSRR